MATEAVVRLGDHLRYLADMLVEAAAAIPDDEAFKDSWVKVAAVAMELTRLGGALGFDGDGMVEP